MKPVLRSLLLTMLSAMLIACTSKSVEPTPAADSPQTTTPAAPTSSPAPAPAPAITDKAPVTEEKLAAPESGDPFDPDRSCKQDSDCAVKDIGNCCGYFPACVNKDAKTDPAAVKAQCAKNDMAGICGFQEITSCRCVSNRCEASSAPGGAEVNTQ